MDCTVQRRWTTLALLVGMAAAATAAAEPVGSVTALDGRGEVQHAGSVASTPLAAGDPVAIGDQLRTAPGARLKLLFRDESVLTLAPSSTLVVTEAVAGAAAPVSRFGLLLGTVRAVVGERYGEPGARFDTETPTAVAGVHGTAFVARYDAEADASVFIGLFHVVCVRGTGDPAAAHQVCLGPGQMTRVARNGLPTPPAPAPTALLEELDAVTSIVTEMGDALAPNAAASTPGPAALRTGLAAPPEATVDQPIPLLEGPQKPPPPPPPVPSEPPGTPQLPNSGRHPPLHKGR